MWLTTVDGFVSLVEDQDDPTMLHVRARVAEDITATFPGAAVFVSEGADYRHRARLPREAVADTIRQAVVDIRYRSHFKDVALEISPPNAWRRQAYYRTWAALATMQDYAPYSRTPRGARERNAR